MITITYDEAVASLNRAVEKKGADYVYDRVGYGCTYFNPDGTPSCIVGHVLADIGVPAFPYDSKENVTSVGSLLWNAQIDVEPRALTPLSLVQRLQDRGVPWGQAFEAAFWNGGNQ